MKKIITILFLLAAIQSVSAQRGGGGRADDGPRFGWDGEAKGNGLPTVYSFVGGVNTSTVAPAAGSSFSAKQGWRTGFQAGITMAVPVSKTLSIRPEALYTRLNSGRSSADYTLRLSCLSFPLLAQFTIPGVSDLHLLAGPQFNFLLAADQTDHNLKTSFGQNISNNSIALAAGAEYMPGLVGLAVRYQHGINSIDRNTGVYGGQIRSLSVNLMIKL